MSPDERDVFSIPEFCVRHRISTALFFKMLREGRAPRVMRAGRRTLITREAAEDWRRALEAASVQPREREAV
jgi:hypothetical protein